MPATLADLVKIRSQPAEEALAFLEWTAKAAAEVPPWYPEHLQALDPGSEKFDAIRQVVQAHDRKTYSEWLAKEQKRLRAAGLPDKGLAYRDKRSRTEDDDDDRSRGRGEEKPKPPPIVWDQGTGARYRRAVILGDPGFGKSWLLRFEARHLALSQFKALFEQTITVDDVVLPLWARLSDLTANNPDLESTLLDHFCRKRSSVFRRLLETRLSPQREKAQQQTIERDATIVRAVLLLDALDEVPEPNRQALRQRLSEFADAHPDVRILITSRLVGYAGLPLRDGNELELLPFNPNQIQHFLRVWFGESAEGKTKTDSLLAALKTRPTLQALARIPLMLTLLCRTYQANPNHFPTRRVELYEICLRGLLRDWNALRRKISDGYIEAVLELLAPVAFELWTQGRQQFHETELRDVVRDELREFDSTHELNGRNATSVIEELKETGILVTVGIGVDAPLIFLHRTFHEYLVACHLAQKHQPKDERQGWSKIAPLVSRKAWLPEWQEVIVLLAGSIEDPIPLLEMLGDPNPTALNPHGDDVFRHWLRLACLCVSEIEPVKLDKHSKLLYKLITQAVIHFTFGYERDSEVNGL